MCNDWNERWVTEIDEFHPNIVDAPHRGVGPPRPQDRRHVVPAGPGRLRPLLPVGARPGHAGAHVAGLEGGDPHHPVLLPSRSSSGRPVTTGPSTSRGASTASTRSTATSSSRIPGRYTLIDLNRFVSPGGKYAESIDGIRIRGDGVHFTLRRRGLRVELARAAARAGGEAPDQRGAGPRRAVRPPPPAAHLIGCASPSSGTPASTSRRARARSSSTRGCSGRATGDRGGTTRRRPSRARVARARLRVPHAPPLRSLPLPVDAAHRPRARTCSFPSSASTCSPARCATSASTR